MCFVFLLSQFLPSPFRRISFEFLFDFVCVYVCVCVCVSFFFLSSFFLLSFFFPPVVCLMIFSCCEWMTGSITANKLVPIVWVHRYSFVWFIATAAGDPLAWIGSSFLDPSRSIPIHLFPISLIGFFFGGFSYGHSSILEGFLRDSSEILQRFFRDSPEILQG